MKKIPLLIILAMIPIVGLINSCNKEESCPERTEIGQLFWSDETEDWFPSKYLNQPAALKFESENGDVIEFELDRSNIIEGYFESFDMECENGEGITRVRWADRRYSGRFLTQDSMVISIGIGVWNEKLSLHQVIEADYYEWILISLYRLNDGTGDDLGRVRIVTDLRNAELEEIDHSPNKFEEHNNFEFMGDEYSKIYCDSDPDFSNSNIYFQKGIGMVGFKDEDGIKWKIKE